MTTIQEKISENKKFEEELNANMPYKTMCLLGGKNVSVSGETVSFTGEGDFISVEDAREAIEWIVSQLGGNVKWRK